MYIPGDDVDDGHRDFEEQLLEELLQHFETGVGNSVVIDVGYIHLPLIFLRQIALGHVSPHVV